MTAPTRQRLTITGAVQGVGFRPFVHQLAGEIGLAGWVRNSSAGVEIEVEGNPNDLETFCKRLRKELPPHATIASFDCAEMRPEGASDFAILPSRSDSSSQTISEVLPDLATCPECLAEVLDSGDRRFGYPFTNCTHCGPRYSIILDLPYDRARTTMRAFEMCPACQAEYKSPTDRRFHAQPNACPDCGPQLSWLDASGNPQSSRKKALESAATAIEAGKVVAIKGIGGFHLFCDARSPKAIADLRKRKHRASKPLAVMAPSLESAREFAAVCDEEADWLTSATAPIVILPRRADSPLPESLAPGNPTLGVMLPYSPLHHLLMRRLRFPVVATSGNRSDEPICIDNGEAVKRLAGIADGFLVHDRPIARAVDDSVIRRMAGEQTVLRRSRGLAPAPIPVADISTSVLAYGGDLKGTIAVADHGRVRLSQHFGDLETLESREAFETHLEDFPSLCRAEPEAIARDRHPAYHSHQAADSSPLPTVDIQHHHAHAVACAAEHGIEPDEAFLAVVWDGTGYSEDGTIWGGEFLRCRGADWERFAWLRPFPLPGGEKAVRDPRFAALGALHQAGIPVEETTLAERLSDEERTVAESLLRRGLNSPMTSSMGRLFDAVSALCGLASKNDFEGQAAMALEFAASPSEVERGDPLEAGESAIDWTPMLAAIVRDLGSPTPKIPAISRRFHETLADLTVAIARSADCLTVALTGGCFQNALLLELAIARLTAAGFRPIRHRLVPPNDGGLALGQAVIASRRLSDQTP